MMTRDELKTQYPRLGFDAWMAMEFEKCKYDAMNELASQYGKLVSEYMKGDFRETVGTTDFLEALEELDLEYRTLKAIINSDFDKEEAV